ncbi:MAG: hypothetical protein CMJ40_02180 [Phycisphaerae bacterium]|nr:hypothetical protein [Phycisphaerae bacterium]
MRRGNNSHAEPGRLRPNFIKIAAEGSLKRFISWIAEAPLREKAQDHRDRFHEPQDLDARVTAVIGGWQSP